MIIFIGRLLDSSFQISAAQYVTADTQPNQPNYKDMILSTYEELGKRLKSDGILVKDKIELMGTSIDMVLPLKSIQGATNEFKWWLNEEGYDWQKKADMEKFHYEKLAYSLSHALAENWFYLREPVDSTRRAVALSSDCISAIQAKLQKDILHLSVFFRSSHYSQLLPMDLIFLAELGPQYLRNADETSDTFKCGWGDILDRVKSIHCHLMFGSLHMEASSNG